MVICNFGQEEGLFIVIYIEWDATYFMIYFLILKATMCKKLKFLDLVGTHDKLDKNFDLQLVIILKVMSKKL